MNFDVDNFRVDAQGTLIDIVNHENASYEINDGAQREELL